METATRLARAVQAHAEASEAHAEAFDEAERLENCRGYTAALRAADEALETLRRASRELEAARMAHDQRPGKHPLSMS